MSEESEYFVFNFEGKPCRIAFLSRGVSLKFVLKVSEEIFRVPRWELFDRLVISLQVRDAVPSVYLKSKN